MHIYVLIIFIYDRLVDVFLKEKPKKGRRGHLNSQNWKKALLKLRLKRSSDKKEKAIKKYDNIIRLTKERQKEIDQTIKNIAHKSFNYMEEEKVRSKKTKVEIKISIQRYYNYVEVLFKKHISSGTQQKPNEVSPGTFQLMSNLGLQTPNPKLPQIEEEEQF